MVINTMGMAALDSVRWNSLSNAQVAPQLLLISVLRSAVMATTWVLMNAKTLTKETEMVAVQLAQLNQAGSVNWTTLQDLTLAKNSVEMVEYFSGRPGISVMMETIMTMTDALMIATLRMGGRAAVETVQHPISAMESAETCLCLASSNVRTAISKMAMDAALLA